jgi:transketolase
MAVKAKFGFNPNEFFHVPEETKAFYATIGERGAALEKKWQETLQAYEAKYPAEAADIKRRIAGTLPEGWEKILPTFTPADPAVASRKLSETIIAKISAAVPEFVSGSADLTPSNLTTWKGAVDFQPPSTGLGTYAGRYVSRFEI